MNYDIFISYRREDGKEFARQIQLKLENYGYSVFLDVEELKDGVFDQRIIDAICGSKVFIALLTPRYMSRCVDENDWVRKEIECAAEHNLHIVPININREFTDFPSDCPCRLCNHIGQHQYSEVFTGQQFSNTMNDLNEHRLRPHISGLGNKQQSNIGAIVRIKPDMNCRVMKFGEEIASLQKGIYNVLRLMKGKHLLDFVSVEFPEDHIEKNYVVEDNDSEDFFEIELIPIKNKRIRAIEAEKRRKQEEEERRKREQAEAERKRLEELERKKAAKLEAERRAKEEAVRQAKEENERKEAERQAKERLRLIEIEKERVSKLVLEGKGRDGIYMPGDYYDRDGIKGIVVHSSAHDASHYPNDIMIIGLKESRAQWACDRNFGSLFKRDNPSSQLQQIGRYCDGVSAMRAVKSKDVWREKFPVYEKAERLGVGSPSLGWFPLSSYEFEYVNLNFDKINKTLRRLSYPEIKKNSIYWTANEFSEKEATAVKIGGGEIVMPKTSELLVRPFAEIFGASLDYDNINRWSRLGLYVSDDGISTNYNFVGDPDWCSSDEERNFKIDETTNALMAEMVLDCARKINSLKKR